jgi:electron transport complex protein RnfA
MGVYLTLITTNCAVLAVTLNCISKNYNYIESLVYAAGSAAGFMISMIVMAGVRDRMKTAKLPAFINGRAILFIAAGLLSMAFLGFSGLIK